MPKTSPKLAAEKAKHTKRADLGAAVDTYFARLGPEHKSIATRLHALVRKAAPKVTGAVKWGMPVYEHRGMLCYIRSRPAYVTLGFYQQGIELDDPKGLLTGTGQNMRHIKIPLGEKPDEKYLAGLVKQAAKINERDDAISAMAGKRK